MGNSNSSKSSKKPKVSKNVNENNIHTGTYAMLPKSVRERGLQVLKQLVKEIQDEGYEATLNENQLIIYQLFS